MPQKLTYKYVRSLKPRDKDFTVFDSEVKGLMLRVRPNGKKTFRIEYGRNLRATIGDANIITAQQARDKAIQILADKKNGIKPARAASIPTLERFLTNSYEKVAIREQKTGQETMARIRFGFADWMNLRLDQITIKAADDWRAGRLKFGKTNSTVNRDFAAIKAVLNRAVSWGVIESNPIAKLKPLKVDKQGVIRYLSEDEDHRLRAALEHTDPRAPYLKPLVLVDLNTGLRKGELLNLKWNDVDLDQRNIRVLGSGAKTSQTRHVHLNSEAFGVLSEMVDDCESNDYVFKNPQTGGRLGHFRRSWEGLMKNADIKEKFRVQDMRHDFCSQHAMSGTPLNDIRQMAGHADFATTLRYAHLSPDHQKATVERLVERRKSR
jgi:integrase